MVLSVAGGGGRAWNEPMSEPKLHHYVPQFYLEGFSNARWQVAVHDLDKSQFRYQSVRKTARVRDYYTITDEKGTKDRGLEKLLSILEGHTKPIIKKVEESDQLTDEERFTLAMFASFQLGRVPKFEQWTNGFAKDVIQRLAQLTFSDKERTKKALASVGKPCTDAKAEEMMEFMKSGEYTLEIAREHSLTQMLNAATKLPPLFVQMNWLFARRTARPYFVTSDNPFYIVPSPTAPPLIASGMLTPGTMKVIPLSKRVALMMLDHGGETKGNDVTEDFAMSLNLVCAARTSQCVYADDMNSLREVISKATKKDSVAM